MIRPQRLKLGDTIGLLAPASGVADGTKIDRAVTFFEAQGFRVKLAPNARAVSGFLSAPDPARLSDFHGLWRDPEVKALICLRGGYGTCRIVDQLDYDLIRSQPKILLGYSDITNLHLSIMRRAGVVTFHGPMAAANFSKADSPVWTWEMVRRALMGEAPVGSIVRGAPLQRPPETLFVGAGRPVSGPLVGGNLAHVQVTLGTPDEIDTRGAIVFLEDLSERPYRIDRMLTHLLAAGKLRDAAGIALGIFEDCGEPGVDPEGDLYPPGVLQVFRDRLGGLGIPVVHGLPISHTPVNATIPMGVLGTLDPNAADLIVEECGVA